MFVTEQTDDEIIGWSLDISHLFLKTVFFQYHHLILKDVTIVLLQQFFISEVNAKLLQGIIAKVLKPEDIQQIDRW